MNSEYWIYIPPPWQGQNSKTRILGQRKLQYYENKHSEGKHLLRKLIFYRVHWKIHIVLAIAADGSLHMQKFRVF